MFKKRMIEFLCYLIGVPLLFGLMMWFGILIGKYTPAFVWLDFLQAHNNTVIGIIMGLMFLVFAYSFINWLFIEPYKNYRKQKNVKGDEV